MKEESKDNVPFLYDIFQQAQRSSACHEDCINSILERFSGRNRELFNHFKQISKQWFLQFKQDTPTKNVEKFIVKICGTEAFETFQHLTLHHAVNLSQSPHKAVRLRCCRLIHLIFDREDSEEAFLDNTLWDKTLSAMLRCLKDKICQVRRAAIQASNRLQGKDEEDLHERLVEMMEYDPDKQCRLLCVQTLEMTHENLGVLVNRTRAREPDIRKAVFERLLPIKMKRFSIKMRTALFKNGLTDRQESVRHVCVKLLEKWLENLDWDIWKFLQLFDLAEYSEDLEESFLIFLGHFNDDLKHGEHKPPFTKEQLEPLQADVESESLLLEMTHRCRGFYWGMLVKWSIKEHNHGRLNQLIGDMDIQAFCDMFEASKGDHFMACQLLRIGLHLDFQDNFGRNLMVSYARGLLKDEELEEGHMADVLAVLRKLYVNNEKEFLRIVREDLEEIADPLEHPLEDKLTAEKRAEIEKLQENRQKQIAEYDEIDEKLQEQKDFEKADEIAIKREAIYDEYCKTDEILFPMEWKQNRVYHRQLSIIEDVIKHTRLSPDHPFIGSLKEDCILKILMQEVIQRVEFLDLKKKCLEVLATFCCLSKELALEHLWLFLHYIDVEPDNISIFFKAIFDFLFLFSFSDQELSNAKNPNGTEESNTLNLTNQMLFEMLSQEFLNSGDVDLRNVCVEGFTRLLLNNRLKFKKRDILVEMMIMYHQLTGMENDEVVDRIAQVLAMFFPTYYSNAEAIKNGCKEMLLTVLIKCIETITTSPQASPRRKLKCSSVIDYVFWFVNNDDGAGEHGKPVLHCKLAYKILSQLNKNSSGGSMFLDAQRAFCFALSKLELAASKSDLEKCKDLITLINVNIVDKQSSKNWRTFRKNFDLAFKKAEENNQEEAETILNESIMQQVAQEPAFASKRKENACRRRSLAEVDEFIPSPNSNAKKKKLRARVSAKEELVPPAKRPSENPKKPPPAKRARLAEESDDEDLADLLQE